MASKPISPGTVLKKVKKTPIPDQVIESFNEIIEETFNKKEKTATFLLKAVEKKIIAKGIKRADIHKNNWLDVEEIFEAAGWAVGYDSPSRGESYEAYFIFSIKTK